MTDPTVPPATITEFLTQIWDVEFLTLGYATSASEVSPGQWAYLAVFWVFYVLCTGSACHGLWKSQP